MDILIERGVSFSDEDKIVFDSLLGENFPTDETISKGENDHPAT